MIMVVDPPFRLSAVLPRPRVAGVVLLLLVKVDVVLQIENASLRLVRILGGPALKSVVPAEEPLGFVSRDTVVAGSFLKCELASDFHLDGVFNTVGDLPVECDVCSGPDRIMCVLELEAEARGVGNAGDQGRGECQTLHLCFAVIGSNLKL